MKRLCKSRILLSFLMVGILCGCVEEINMATHEELPYVVVCILSDSEEQTLDLYKPRYSDQSDYIPVHEASVILQEEDQTVGTFHFNGEKWICQFTPEYGHTYNIRIEIPGEKLISAKTRMPDKIRLFEFKTFSQNSDGINEELQSIFFQFRTEGQTINHGISIRDTSYRYNGECNVWLYPVREYDLHGNSCITIVR